MAARGKKSASRAEAWLVDGVPEATGQVKERVGDDAARPESAAEDIGPKTREWLAIPPPAGGVTESKRLEPKGDGKSPGGEVSERDTRGEQDLSSKLSDAELLIAKQRDEIDELHGRVRELESEVAQAKKAAKKAPASRRKSGSRARSSAT